MPTNEAGTLRRPVPTFVADPIKFAWVFWPDLVFSAKQWDVIYSAEENDETYVPAANMTGKDFVGGFYCLYFFLTRHPCRIITTSAKDQHLAVLWGEIGNFVQRSKFPLDYKRRGNLILNHQDIRKVVHGRKCELSYLRGMVAGEDSMAAMQGHHVAKTGDGVPRTLFVCDESSSVRDEYYKMAVSWADRMLIFGNCWQTRNFFYRGVMGGDILRQW